MAKRKRTYNLRRIKAIGGLKHKKPRGTDEDAMAEKIAEMVAAKLQR